jgi:hypothetical protein
MTKNSRSKKYQSRQSKLTPELQAKVILSIKGGNYIEVACGLVGINKSTFYDWIKKGKNSNNPNNKYRKFQEAVVKAKYWSQARDVAFLNKHNEENWKAAAWKLERQHPDKYGLKEYEDYDSDFTESNDNSVNIPKTDSANIKEALDLIASKKKNNNPS